MTVSNERLLDNAGKLITAKRKKLLSEIRTVYKLNLYYIRMKGMPMFYKETQNGKIFFNKCIIRIMR
jgi:hypothetical protein